MPASGDRKALVISGWLTGLYFIVELGIGIWTDSVLTTTRNGIRKGEKPEEPAGSPAEWRDAVDHGTGPA